MVTAYGAIAEVMSAYFDGLYHSDSSRLASVFHARAHYVCPTEDALVYRTMAEYFAIVDARPAPASRGEPRHDRIVSIEFGDCEWTGKIAVAEVDVLERKLKKLSLPGHLRLKHGIAIPIS